MTMIEQAKLPGFKLSVNGLEAQGKVTEEQWKEAGQFLGQMIRTSMFAIGDWINTGEEKWGKTYVEAMEITGLAYGTLRNAARVCRSIELSRRRDNLSDRHHTDVAALDPADQDRWLEKAEQEGLSSMALRSGIRRETPKKNAWEQEGGWGQEGQDWEYAEVDEEEATESAKGQAEDDPKPEDLDEKKIIKRIHSLSTRIKDKLGGGWKLMDFDRRGSMYRLRQAMEGLEDFFDSLERVEK